jgi:hypothetical protein
MPEGDYLSESFTSKRHMYIPVKFPEEFHDNIVAVPQIGVTYNRDINLVQYIAEPFMKPLTYNDNCVEFYRGDFSFFDSASEKNDGIICVVQPFLLEDHLNLATQTIMAARDGDFGFVYPLWNVSDEIKATFYWEFLENLATGKGFWNSFIRSRSYIFGHYNGLPDTWGAFVYVCLK